MCEYVASSKSGPSSNIPKVNLNNELIRLKLKINKLERILSMNDIDISKYDNILPEFSKSDENDNTGDDEDDPLISLCNKFDTMVLKENRIMHSGTTTYVTYFVHDKQLASVFQKYSERHAMIYESYQQRQKVKASDLPTDVADNHLAFLTSNSFMEPAICEGDSSEVKGFGGILAPSNSINNMQTKLVLDVIGDVNKILPPLFVVNALVDQFFQYVYPFIPLIDEDTFRDELSYVLVPVSGGGCKVAITHLQNTSIISLLLMILRFAYLTVNVKDYGDNIKAIGNEFLLAMIQGGHVIGSHFVVLAKTLLMSLPAEDSIFKKVTLRNIQVLTYLRLYQAYSPEMHEEGKEHSMTLSLIIQMCRSIGANRDPANFSNIYKDERTIIIWRRIFYRLLMLDAQNAFEYGCPLIISDDEYDVKLPALDSNSLQVLKDFKNGQSVDRTGSEMKKLVSENAINKDISLEYDATLLLREGLKSFQNFRDSTKVSRLHNIVDRIQQFVDTKLPSFCECVMNIGTSTQLEKLFDVPRVKKLEIRLTVQNMLVAFYYLLYLNNDDGSPLCSPASCDGNSASTGSFSGPSHKDSNGSDGYSGSNDGECEDDEDLESDRNDASNAYHKYTAKATEVSLSLFKASYDYTNYMTQSATLDGDSRQYKAMKLFSANCDTFILNRVSISFLRPFCFICSLFLKNMHGEKVVTIESLLKSFSNTVDATVVLKWFNVNLTSPEKTEIKRDEFSFLIFHYVKQLFFSNFCLRNEYFVCWRTSVIIKIFINYFKQMNSATCQLFLDPTAVPSVDVTYDMDSIAKEPELKLFEDLQENTPKHDMFSVDSAGNPQPNPNVLFNMDSGKLDDDIVPDMHDITGTNMSLNINGSAANTVSSTTPTTSNFSVTNDGPPSNGTEDAFLDNFLNNSVYPTQPENNADYPMDDLLYENFDAMMDDIFQDTISRNATQSLFNAPGGLSFAEIESMSKIDKSQLNGQFLKNLSHSNGIGGVSATQGAGVNINDFQKHGSFGSSTSQSYSGSSYTGHSNSSASSKRTPDIFKY